MTEVGVVLCWAPGVHGHEERPYYWHQPTGRTGGSLPDSRALWDVLWAQRYYLSGVAHSHPGRGQPGPSTEDLTTFAAVEAALGRRLLWWIVSEDQAVVLLWIKDHYHSVPLPDEPEWITELRRRSYAEG